MKERYYSSFASVNELLRPLLDGVLGSTLVIWIKYFCGFLAV